MLLALACALGTSLCYGVGSVLQAMAARGAAPSVGADPRLLLRLARSWRYVVGLGLDGFGFVLSLVALQGLPLYLVQAVVASSLAVTAVVGVLLAGLRLSSRELGALVVLVASLVVVGLSAAPESATPMGNFGQLVLVAAALALVVLTVAAGRVLGAHGAAVLGGVAGLAFGVVAIAARSLSAPDPARGLLSHLLQSPASYSVVVAAPLALVAYATALQRGGVVQATAMLVVGETVAPAVVGAAFLGDHARPGWLVAGWVGFVCAVGAALVLSRFGELEGVDPEASR